MIQEQEVVKLGYLSRTHGKQGDLQLQSSSDLLADADPTFLVLLVDGILTPFRLDDWRQKNAEAYILSLHDIDSEEKALSLCGTEVYLLRRDAQEEHTEVLTMQDLIGFNVIDIQHGPIGTIIDIDESTANRLFLLEGDIVIPAHDDFVEDINYDTRQLFLNLPDGLL